MTLWNTMMPTLESAQKQQLIQETIKSFEGTALNEIRGDRNQLAARASATLQALVSRYGWQAQPAEIEAMAREVVAHIVGLGFLEPLLRLDSGYSEIAVTPKGEVWAVPRGEQDFVKLPLAPSKTEVFRAIETILAPLGRSLSEASPSVDAKIERSPNLPGGARVKILHPVIAPGEGYPSINVRLFQPKPVPPQQLIDWQVAPAEVVNALVQAVSDGTRLLVCGGTASGKTTLLSALCNGIPQTARVCKIEDPEEIWMDHPHVVTLEARPKAVGSSVPPYTLADGVDDAMRMSPRWLIVGEMRKGDAINALFRAQMSDHPGLSTYHAESPEAAVKRMTQMLWADSGVQAGPGKELFAEAVDMLVQVGFRVNSEGKARRRIVGIYAVNKTLKGGNVDFKTLYHLPGEEATGRERYLRLFDQFMQTGEATHEPV